MKKLNLFSDLWSSVAGSQRNDVEFDRRLTVGSPSGFTINWTLKLVSVLVLVLTIGIGNVWGAEEVVYTLEPATGSNSGYAGNCDVEIDDITWNITGNSQQIPWRLGGKSLSKVDRAIYSKTAISNNVTKIVITHGAASSITVNSMSVIVSTGQNGGGTVTNTLTPTFAANGDVTVNRPAGKDWSGKYYKIVYNVTVSSTSNKYVQFTRAKFYAEEGGGSCSTPPTVGSTLSSVSSTVNSITATVPISAIGGCSITENGLVYSTTNSTPTVGGTGCTKVTVTACGSTAANKTVTISDLICGQSYYVRGYATNAAGTSYTNVTTRSTSACPVYTVTLKDDNSTYTQASYGASVTLPSRTGCTGYTFAGWTKTWVAPQSSWTTTAPTIIPAGSYTPSADENLYPVYTKTEGGGMVFDEYEKCTTAPDDWTAYKYIYATADDGYALAGKASGGNYGDYASFSTTTEMADYELTLEEGSTDNYKVKQGGKYISCSSFGNLYWVDTYTAKTSSVNNGDWQLYKPTGTAYRIESPVKNSNNKWIYIDYNSSSPRFNSYVSGGQTAAYLYKRKEKSGSTTYYISEANCCSLQAATSVTVTSVAATSVTLDWTAPSPATGITKLQVVDGNGTVKVDNLAASATSATITGLEECESYTFHVVSVGASCNVSSATVEAQPFSGAKTVTYNYHEGTGSPASFTTDCSHTSTTLPTPTRANYRFDGWYDAATSGSLVGAGGASYTPSANITLHAYWTQVYTVTYNYNGGSGSCVAGGPYAAGATVTTCAAATKAGSTLTGWRRSDNDATVIPGNTFAMPASNVTLTAVWADTPYTLTQNVGTHTTKGYSTATIKSGDLTSGGLDMTYTISDNSYALPKAVTISGGGQTWTLGTDYTWTLSADKHSATLHLGSNLTISENVTVTIAEQTRYTVVWDEHGSTTTEYYAADDNNVTMKGGIADCGEKKFYGWTEDAGFVSNPTTPPTMASSGAISGNKHYYAIFADAEVPANPGYVKVTSISAGTYLIATTSQAYTGKVDGQTYGGHVAVSVSDGVISSKPNDAVEVTVTLGTGVNAGKFDIYDGTYHLSSKDKGITFAAAASFEWQLTGEGYIKNTNGTHYLQYNSASPRFASYSSAQTKAYLYKKQTTTYSNFSKTCTLYDITITTPSGGTVTTTPSAGTGAAGEGQTVTVNVTPNSCKYLSALKYNDGSDHAISIASAPYTFTMPASDVTVTATFEDKSVSSIAANTSTHRTLMHNTSFVGEQIRVTYNNGETEDLAWDDATLTFSGYNMSTLGDQTVSVAYDGDCGEASTSYSIEITDGIPVTFSDCGITTVNKYDPGDVVPVESTNGAYACSGWEFAGWSESSVAANSTSFTPVRNFNASTARTLYAVYAHIRKDGSSNDLYESADMIADLQEGARYVIAYLANNNTGISAGLSGLLPTVASTNYLSGTSSFAGTEDKNASNSYVYHSTATIAANAHWQLMSDGTGYWQLYNKTANKYLDLSGHTNGYIAVSNSPVGKLVISNYNESVGDNNSQIQIKYNGCSDPHYVSWNRSSSYFNQYSSGKVFMLTKDEYFSSTPPCSPKHAIFHGNGGTVIDNGGVSRGGNYDLYEVSRDAGIKLPTATYSDCSGKTWTFAGWLNEERDLSRKPVLTTELLNDGVGSGNVDYDIVDDGEEFYAVYSSQGEALTTYGEVSFSKDDVESGYNTSEKTITKSGFTFGYLNVSNPSGSGMQFKENDGAFYNKTSLGKINSIQLGYFAANTIANVKVYVGNAIDDVTTEITSANRIDQGTGISATYTYYPQDDYEYMKIVSSGGFFSVSSITVEYGKGTLIYATTPDCSTISLSGDVYVTSRNGIGIMAATPLTVEAHQLDANANVVITSNSSDVYFSTDRTPNFSKASKPTVSVTVRANASGELSATPIYVHYKPGSAGTGAASDVTVYANLSTPDPNVKSEHNIHVRNLSDKIVIAAKVGGAYYALPADMDAATNPAGVLIDVNEEDMTATAPENCSYTIWPVKTTAYSGDRYEGYGERVRFSAVNNSDKGLWANNSTSSGDDTKINNNAAIASISADPAAAYEWKITTTVTDGKWSHTLQTDQSNNTKYLRYWTAASGGPKWGTYASGEQILYLLPVTEVTPFEMEVVEWYPTKVLVNTTSDLTGNTLTVRVNGSVDGDAAVTGKGSNLYEISNLDLAGNPTKSLRVDYGTSPINSCTKAIPVIISRSTQNVTAAPFTTLTKEVYNKADLVVRDNAVLTLNGTIAENTFSSVTIYPTAKISVPSGKKLTANSLTFFGGIDDIYNGSTYTVNKYGVPELSLKGSVGKALSTINYDMRVDISQMYALALPYDVNIAAITYWDGTAMTPGTNLYISAYDGQARVNRESRTWIYEEDFEEKLGAATLKAGVGYTISAELQSGFGNEYSIIRMPMQAGLTVDATEVAKTVAVVAYVNNQGATVTDNHKGWNFVGNPYMTSISGSSAGGASDAKLIVGCLVPNTNVDPWDGSYMWRDDTYRYVTIPSDDGSENWQSKWTEVTLKPFKNFFIQVGTSGDLSFALASRADAPARYMQAQEHEVEFEVLLSSEMSHDHTGLLLADKYTPAYEINADLEKMENPMSVYTLTGGYKLAYNALSPNDAKQPIPVGYIANEAGIYTFELDENSNVDEVEHVWLTDYELNRVTDLMDATYEFTTVVGRNETRFALTVELRSGEEIATDIGNSVDGIDNDGAVKFIWHDKMYILNQGVIYDATGKRVREIDK